MKYISPSMPRTTVVGRRRTKRRIPGMCFAMTSVRPATPLWSGLDRVSAGAYAAGRPDHLLGKALHFLGLRTHLQQQQVETRRLEGSHALADLLGRTDQPGPQTPVGNRVLLQFQLALQLGS